MATTTAFDSPAHTGRRRTSEILLVGLEVATGLAAVAGGLMLAVRPDGSLLRAQMSALQNGPFTDWRLPGILLATLVGAGFLGTGWWQWRRGRLAAQLSMSAGGGLMVFEASELLWIGPQPLEAVFAIVGLTTVVLAARLSRGSSGYR